MRPKGSAAELEARRRQAAKLLAKGYGIREVARRVGAAPSSVKRWMDAYRTGGLTALKAKPHTGRPSRLTPTQRQRLLQALRQSPRTFRIASDRWTCTSVGRVIRRLFGVRYHPDHISRLLRSLGWRYKTVHTPHRQTSPTRRTTKQWVPGRATR